MGKGVGILRVPDGRAVEQGLGALANTCKQCQKQWSGCALTAGLMGGGLGAGINDILYTHLGCFSTWGGVGGSRRAFLHAFQMSMFPIRQAVPVGFAAHFCSWAHWAQFLMEKKCSIVGTTYLHTIHCFINLWIGDKGWMAQDGFGCHFPN